MFSTPPRRPRRLVPTFATAVVLAAALAPAAHADQRHGPTGPPPPAHAAPSRELIATLPLRLPARQGSAAAGVGAL